MKFCLSVAVVTAGVTLGSVTLFFMGDESVVEISAGFTFGSVALFCMESMCGWTVASVIVIGDGGCMALFNICVIYMNSFLVFFLYVSLGMFFCGDFSMALIFAATWRKYKAGVTYGNSICRGVNQTVSTSLVPPISEI